MIGTSNCPIRLVKEQRASSRHPSTPRQPIFSSSGWIARTATHPTVVYQPESTAGHELSGVQMTKLWLRYLHRAEPGCLWPSPGFRSPGSASPLVPLMRSQRQTRQPVCSCRLWSAVSAAVEHGRRSTRQRAKTSAGDSAHYEQCGGVGTVIASALGSLTDHCPLRGASIRFCCVVVGQKGKLPDRMVRFMCGVPVEVLLESIGSPRCFPGVMARRPWCHGQS